MDKPKINHETLKQPWRVVLSATAACIVSACASSGSPSASWSGSTGASQDVPAASPERVTAAREIYPLFGADRAHAVAAFIAATNDMKPAPLPPYSGWCPKFLSDLRGQTGVRLLSPQIAANSQDAFSASAKLQQCPAETFEPSFLKPVKETTSDASTDESYELYTAADGNSPLFIHRLSSLVDRDDGAIGLHTMELLAKTVSASSCKSDLIAADDTLAIPGRNTISDGGVFVFMWHGHPLVVFLSHDIPALETATERERWGIYVQSQDYKSFPMTCDAVFEKK